MTLDYERLLDRTGWQILMLLQQNARMSYSELGKCVGLSTPAVVERVRKLEDAGIITGYRAEVDPHKVGLPITAFLRARTVGGGSARLSELVKELPEVLECHRVTGSDCYILKAVLTSVEHMECLINQLQDHSEVITSIVLSSPVKGRAIGQEQRMAVS